MLRIQASKQAPYLSCEPWRPTLRLRQPLAMAQVASQRADALQQQSVVGEETAKHNRNANESEPRNSANTRDGRLDLSEAIDHHRLTRPSKPAHKDSQPDDTKDVKPRSQQTRVDASQQRRWSENATDSMSSDWDPLDDSRLDDGLDEPLSAHRTASTDSPSCIPARSPWPQRHRTAGCRRRRPPGT